MKKIIPFSKDILFNTNLYEINSISLEHSLKLINEDEITGEFIISGDYKESDTSLRDEPFIYNVPFDIILDSKYSNDSFKIDIDNFNYEIKEPNSLELKISISIDGLELKKDSDLIDIIDIEEERVEEPEIKEIEERVEEPEIKEIEEKVEPVIKVEEDNREVTSIFDNFNNKDDKFVTYNVHIYREKDDINEIIKLYNVSKEEIEEYNDLGSITIGSKIIIPSNE